MMLKNLIIKKIRNCSHFKIIHFSPNFLFNIKELHHIVYDTNNKNNTRMSELIHLEDFLAVPQRLLNYFGISTIKRESEFIFKEGIFYNLSILNIIFTIVLEIVYAYLSLTKQIHFDLQEIMFIGICLCFMFWALFKSLPLVTKKQKICNILKQLRSIHPKNIDDQKKYKTVECLTSMKRIMFHYTSILVSMASVYSGVPFVDVFQVYYETGSWKVDFTYFIWYPFDAYQRGIFEILFLSLCYCAISTSVYIVGGDLFMFGILTQMLMQYDFIRREFLSLHYKQQLKNNSKLKELLNLHIKLCG